MQYLLPCGACGKKHAVDPSQAGQQLACACGASLEVPSLRGLRGLERAEAASGERPGRAWTPGRGVVFAAGVLLAVLGLLIAGYSLLARSGIDTSEPPPADLKSWYEGIEAMTPAQMLEVWQGEVRARGLGPYVPPRHLIAQEFARRCRIIMFVGLVLTAVGVAASAASLRAGTHKSQQ
jgi:hypothetical protein